MSSHGTHVSIERSILDSEPTCSPTETDDPRGERPDKFKIKWDDEADGMFGAKVKKAGHVGDAPGDVEIIGEISYPSRSRPATMRSTSSNYYGYDPNSLTSNVESSSGITRMTANPSELEKEVVFLRRQVETLKEQQWRGPSIDDTVKQLLKGKPCALDFYKSAEQKEKLLDAALRSLDGNCITKVILHIKSTCKPGVLARILKSRPVAINYYASYLRQYRKLEELHQFYDMIQNHEYAGMLMYEQCKNLRSAEKQLQKLNECEMFFRHHSELSVHLPMIQEHITLLKRQMKIESAAASAQVGLAIASLTLCPVMTTLFYCSRFFYRDTRAQSPCDPRTFKTDFKLSDSQFMFMMIKARAAQSDWKSIEELVVVKGMFGSKMKSVIGFRNIVKLMAHYRAPIEEMTKYLNEVTDLDERLKLAMEYQVHEIAINLLYQAKDQRKLEEYFKRVPPGSNFYKQIQTKLALLVARK